MEYLLGIDLATSGAKALLIDRIGKVIGSAIAEYSLSSPYPLWAEQSPEDWWTATRHSIKSVLKDTGVPPGAIRGLGLTGQMHGLVALDHKGNVLLPAILWNDQRTEEQCADVLARVGGVDRLVAMTGNTVLAGFTSPKILWLRQHEPATYERVSHILLPKDYIRFRLTGEHMSDVSDASGTGLFDVAKRRWSKKILRLLDVPEEWLPPALESCSLSAVVSPSASEATGLLAGTPVVAGAGDQAAQAVGSGAIREGVVAATCGTSGVVFASADAFVAGPDGSLHAFCHAVPGRWHLMGVMLSAGGALRWVRDNLGLAEPVATPRGDTYDELTRQAAIAAPGCDGLIFLPYLNGERTPHADPRARAAFVGLTSHHSGAHLIRAVLEGVAFGLRDMLDLLRNLDVRVDEVRMSGGGAKSRLWRQILADVFDAPVARTTVTEGAAYGAAMLAGVGCGLFSSVEEAVAQTVRVADRIDPIPENAATYARMHAIYRSLYPALKPAFQAVNDDPIS